MKRYVNNSSWRSALSPTHAARLRTEMTSTPVTRIDNLVLGSVNASWKRSIDADTLAQAIASGDADEWLVHLATFFSEVRAALIVDFATSHGISSTELAASYVQIRDQTGERNTGLEEALSDIISPYRAERGSKGV